MKNLFTPIMIGLFILFLSSSLFGQSLVNIEKYSKVKITIQDKSDMKELQQAGVSLEGMKLEEQSIEVILSERQIMKLDDLGYSYEILIDDMTKYYQERSRRNERELKNLEREMKENYIYGGFGFGSMAGFYTYDEVVAELDSMRMLYPNLITAKYSIGTTLEGRTIWAAKISDNPDITEGEPEVFYNALIHAREPAGMMVVIYFMYYLLENYGSDPELTYLVDNREFYFVPVINVDGYVYNQQTNPNGGGMWRKNRKDNGNGCFGIDLNRNFGYMWGYNNIGSSPDPCDELYRGTNAFSEFENQALRDYCNSKNFKLAINFHSYGNFLLYPWDYINSPTLDNDWFFGCSALMVVFNGYEAGQSPLVLYEVNGSGNDWMYGEQTTKPKIFDYSTEVGNDNDGFWPIPERIFPLAEENVYLNKVLAWGLGVIDNPPHIFESSVYPSYCVPSEDSITITATESNPDNFNSTVTAYLYDSEDNLLEEFEMSEVNTNTYLTQRLSPQEENFYHLLLKDSGVQIPSNFYYQKDLKFTTAGPVIIDSITVTYINTFPKRYEVKPFVKNNGQTVTVKNLFITMSTEDSSVTYINGSLSVDSLSPGEIVVPTGSFTVRVDTNYFSGLFNFNFAIRSGDWLYWQDSVTYIITGVEEETTLLTEFALEQNYPNPFNPSTTISYSIPNESKVIIKVYDVLGKEIETLINEEKSVGTYELTWNAANLPSGVYFYQLKAGEYVSTKKMILLK